MFSADKLKLSWEVDKKIVQMAVDDFNAIFEKYAALNGIQILGSEKSPGKGKRKSPKKNPKLNYLLDLVADTYQNISLNQRTIVKQVKIIPREEVSFDENKEKHCECCMGKSDRNFAQAGVSSTSLSNETEINSEQVKEAVAEFDGVVQKFHCFRRKYSKLNQLLQIAENALTNARELLIDTTSNTTISNVHCKCCIENSKAHVCNSENDENEERWKKIKVVNNKIEKNEEEIDASTEDDDITPEEKVFAIDLVFKQILQSIPTTTLITSRRVNSSWKSKCTEILLKNQTAKTDIIFEKKLNSNLETIFEILKIANNTGTKFPSTDFRFFGGRLNNKIFQKLITTFGSDFKNFSFDFGYSNGLQDDEEVTIEDIKLMKKLLTVQLRNIEKLIINNHPYLREPYESINISIVPEGPLPNTNTNLKFLDIGEGIPPNIFEIILQVATKLQEIKWDSASSEWMYPTEHNLIRNSSQLLHSLVKFDKSHLVQSVGIPIDQYHFFSDAHEHLVSVKLPLKKIVLNFSFIVHHLVGLPVEVALLGTYISRLLHQYEDTLIDLTLAPFGSLPNFQIPILSKLEILTICGAIASSFPVITDLDYVLDVKYFPEELPLSQLFPSLKRLNVEFHCTSEDYQWERNFNVAQAKTDVHSNVEELYFSSCPPLSWLDNCTHIFPNLTALTIKNQRKKIDEVVKVICKFQKLTNLVLGYHVYSDAIKFPALDAAFTGFTQKTCCKLFEEKCKTLDDDALKEFRVNNSILDIKNLRYLKLILHKNGWKKMNHSVNCNPPITHVSGAFAFAIYSNLQVELEMETVGQDGMKLWTGMDALFPYVHSAEFEIHLL